MNLTSAGRRKVAALRREYERLDGRKDDKAVQRRAVIRRELRDYALQSHALSVRSNRK